MACFSESLRAGLMLVAEDSESSCLCLCIYSLLGYDCTGLSTSSVLQGEREQIVCRQTVSTNLMV